MLPQNSVPSFDEKNIKIPLQKIPLVVFIFSKKNNKSETLWEDGKIFRGKGTIPRFKTIFKVTVPEIREGHYDTYAATN